MRILLLQQNSCTYLQRDLIVCLRLRTHACTNLQRSMQDGAECSRSEGMTRSMRAEGGGSTTKGYRQLLRSDKHRRMLTQQAKRATKARKKY